MMSRVVSNSNKFYLAVALYVAWIGIFSFWVYHTETARLYQELDQSLESAALTTELILPEGFHHQAMSEVDISRTQDMDNIRKLSRFTRDRDIAYIYSLVLRDGKILFTASSATDQELASDKGFVHYWDHYTDADPRLYEVFSSRSKAHLEYSDQWGDFRGVFIPRIAEDGSLYVVAADIRTSYLDSLLIPFLYESLVISALFVLFGIPLFLSYTKQVRLISGRLKEQVEARTTELTISENRINSILEHSPVGIFHYDTTSTLVTINKRFEHIIGAPKETLIGFNMLKELTSQKMLDAVRNSLSGKVGHYEGPYTSVTGNRDMYLHGEFVPIFSDDEKVIGGVGVFNDITSLHVTTDRLKKLSLAVKCSPTAVVITNAEGVIEYVNPKFEAVTGYSITDAIGNKPSLYKSDETPGAVYQELWETIKSGHEWRGELHNRRKNGEIFRSQQFIAPILNESGNITHFVSIQEDITETTALSHKLAYQTSHDSLTGLINRHEFSTRLSRVVKTAQETKTRHVLLFLDLDQFKIINDTSGHVAGDELLRQLGVVLYQHLRQRDTIARLGGDEFAVLIEHCGLQQGVATANNIRTLIEQFQFHWEQHDHSIGVSIGLAQIHSSTVDATEVLKQADTACFAAKDLGRNRVHVYLDDDEQLTKREGEFRWVNEIKQALSENRFLLYAQPIVSLSGQSGGRIYEILLRLKSTNGEIIPPGVFLPAAERYNLSDHIDRWVIDHTFAWIKEHTDDLDDIDHLAINLSGPSLGNEALLGHIIKKIQLLQISPALIKFEITETAAIANLRDAQVFIQTLRDFGCMFALDDFGSGLSSFAYLKNLSVDALKIDGVFVKDIIDDPIDAAMVKSINHIGHVMGMKTIAEFVENDAIKHSLEEMGVDCAQGYGIGRPEPIDSILSNSIPKPAEPEQADL